MTAAQCKKLAKKAVAAQKGRSDQRPDDVHSRGQVGRAQVVAGGGYFRGTAGLPSQETDHQRQQLIRKPRRSAEGSLGRRIRPGEIGAILTKPSTEPGVAEGNPPMKNVT